MHRAVSDFWVKEVGSYTGSNMKISLHDLVTVSNDQYSYTWLNLVAEVGGYVGLFLGYSVFEATNLMELAIDMRWLDYLKTKLG